MLNCNNITTNENRQRCIFCAGIATGYRRVNSMNAF